MCGRITQKSNPKVLGLKIATLVEPLYAATPPAPRYNGAPGQQHRVIRQHPETGARHLGEQGGDDQRERVESQRHRPQLSGHEHGDDKARSVPERSGPEYLGACPGQIEGRPRPARAFRRVAIRIIHECVRDGRSSPALRERCGL